MKKLVIIIFLFVAHGQAQSIDLQRFEEEIASYDGHILHIPLVEFNGQYFPDVDIILREDGTWSLVHIGGEQIPSREIYTPLQIITRQPDDDLDFLAIARIGVFEGTGCQSVVVLPQYYDGNMIILETVRIEDFPEDLEEGCRGGFIGGTIPREFAVVLNTEELRAGTYTVKYRDQTAEFVVPESTRRNFP